MSKNFSNSVPTGPARRRKLSTIFLAVYWPAIFILTHIPVPQVVYKAHVSDKTLHFVTYMILACLMWFSLDPFKRVNWRKCRVWLMILVAAIYSAADELLQSVVERNADPMDFLANLIGVAIGVIIVSLFSFHRALLVMTAVAIFMMENLTEVDLNKLMPLANMMFHVISYAVLSVVWMNNIAGSLNGLAGTKKIATRIFFPAVFLLFVIASSLVLKKGFDARNVTFSITGIICGLFFEFLVGALKKRSDDSAVKV